MRRHQPPSSFWTLLSDVGNLKDLVVLMADPRLKELEAKYRPWRKFRLIADQTDLDPRLAWRAAKMRRLTTWHRLPLVTMEGQPFGFNVEASMLEMLHCIDHALGGGVAAIDAPDGVLSDPELRKRFAIRSLMDEAIDSSRIEGAATSREKAIEFLRSGRPPKKPAEIMVVNNYRAMQRIKEWLERDLSTEMLLELQSILTEGTLKNSSQGGRLRRSNEAVEVADTRTNETVFTPPPAESLPARLRALCEFANANHQGADFIHPIIKASILHFMLGYEHPFVDGNGRAARAVFYWFALRNGYHVFEYLVISELILKGFARYPRAFSDVEDDDGDMTYFLLYKLDIISQAIDELRKHLGDEEKRLSRSLQLLSLDPHLNLRQRLLLERAVRRPKSDFTVRSHATENNVVPVTARADLEALRNKNLLATYKVGKEVHYVLAPHAFDALDRRIRH